jgi:hypothetical protein
MNKLNHNDKVTFDVDEKGYKQIVGTFIQDDTCVDDEWYIEDAEGKLYNPDEVQNVK